jgi:GGDEF domain-containing protein
VPFCARGCGHAARATSHRRTRCAIVRPLTQTRPPAVRAAQQDALTGLASRLQLEDRLDAAALRAEAQRRRLALRYIDLDGFQPINELYG